MAVRCSISTHSSGRCRGARCRTSARAPGGVSAPGRDRPVRRSAGRTCSMNSRATSSATLFTGLPSILILRSPATPVRFPHVLDLEVLGFAARSREQRVRQVTGVVRISGGSRGGHARKVPRRHHRQRRAANALGLVFLAHEAAGAHAAGLAAGALVFQMRQGFSFFGPVERGRYLLSDRQPSRGPALPDRRISDFPSWSLRSPFSRHVSQGGQDPPALLE